LQSLALRRLAALVAVFFALYGVLLFVGLRTPLGVVIERAIAETAIVGMAVLAPTPVERSISVDRDGSRLQYHEKLSLGAETKEASFGHNYHAQNFLLFAALVLASPGLSLRQRGVALAVGFPLIFVLDAVIVMGDLWVAENTAMAIDSRMGANRGLAEVGFILRFLHPTGGAFMAPIFVWAILLLGPYRAQMREALAPRRPESAGA
jgi:hypothetical protein